MVVDQNRLARLRGAGQGLPVAKVVRAEPAVEPARRTPAPPQMDDEATVAVNVRDYSALTDPKNRPANIEVPESARAPVSKPDRASDSGSSSQPAPSSKPISADPVPPKSANIDQAALTVVPGSAVEAPVPTFEDSLTSKITVALSSLPANVRDPLTTAFNLFTESVETRLEEAEEDMARMLGDMEVAIRGISSKVEKLTGDYNHNTLLTLVSMLTENANLEAMTIVIGDSPKAAFAEICEERNLGNNDVRDVLGELVSNPFMITRELMHRYRITESEYEIPPNFLNGGLLDASVDLKPITTDPTKKAQIENLSTWMRELTNFALERGKSLLEGAE